VVWSYLKSAWQSVPNKQALKTVRKYMVPLKLI
jgi:hypothetical protein